MLASLLAGMAFGNSDVGAVHCLAESIGSLYETPHGVANAVFLPYVMESNLLAARDKYASVAAAVGLEFPGKDEAASALISKIKNLSRSLSIPSFQDLGIPESDFAAIAKKSSAKCFAFSNSLCRADGTINVYNFYIFYKIDINT